jgi:hypothetical protein
VGLVVKQRPKKKLRLRIAFAPLVTAGEELAVGRTVALVVVELSVLVLAVTKRQQTRFISKAMSKKEKAILTILRLLVLHH